ncbi:MAG: protein kinase [Nitrospirae bacterium]|nr:protein kinase [Nitrospirota bacterium]
MAKLKDICPGCFKDKGTDSICTFCGYNEHVHPNNIALPLKTLLKEKQYIVGKILGKQGGFGITYLGLDIKLQAKVAIKEYFPRGSVGRDSDRKALIAFTEDDEEILKGGIGHFLKEARLLAQFSHPNIVRVRSFFEENNTAYIVMDYYDGISLDDYRIQKGGKLTEEEAKKAMLPLLNGLNEVHKKEVLHRDIKPQNIYITKKGMTILIDFGTARLSVSEKSQNITVALTEGFAPFEQYQKHGKQGPWTDIYAYGATFYNILSGVVPTDATSRKSNKTLIPISNLVKDISPTLNKLITKCMAVEPSMRPQNIDAVTDLLANKENGPTLIEPPPPPIHDMKILERLINIYSSHKNVVIGISMIFSLIVGSAVIYPLFNYFKIGKSKEYLIDGDKFMESNQYKDAIESYTRAIKYNSKYTEAFMNRSLSYYTVNMYKDSFTDCKKAIELDKNNLYAYDICGHVLYSASKNGDVYDLDLLKSAANYIQLAVQLGLDDKETLYEIYVRLSNSYLMAKDYGNALTISNNAIKLNLNGYLAYRLRGIANYLQGYVSTGMEDIEKANQLGDPNAPSILHLMHNETFNGVSIGQ